MYIITNKDDETDYEEANPHTGYYCVSQLM